MGLISKIFQEINDVVEIGTGVTRDVFTLGGTLDENGETHTSEALAKIKEREILEEFAEELVKRKCQK